MNVYIGRFYYASENQFYQYWYDTETDLISFTNIPGGVLSTDDIPAIGEVIHAECVGPDLKTYVYNGGMTDFDPQVDIVILADQAQCCTLAANEFQISKTNNTSLVTPNGTIVVTSPSLTISDFEASIDGGTTYIPAADGAITFTGLNEGDYSVIVKAVDGICNVTLNISVVNFITYPPLLIEDLTTYGSYTPVYRPIEFVYQLQNNEITIKNDEVGIYLEVTTDDGRDYFLTMPIFKILDSTYAGVYEVIDVDDLGDPGKFYFNGTYTTDQTAIFVPYGNQIFQLYGEKTLNVMAKIADISIAADSEGLYKVRLEGFLQSLFQVVNPAITIDLSLCRKYYVVPVAFELTAPSVIRTALYSTVSDVVPYLEDFTPFGPLPINFINEQTQKGHPVIFSIINDETKRVENVISSGETDITTAASNVYIAALPMNEYDFQWVGASPIADLQTDPELPEWIEVISTDNNTVMLKITTYTTDGEGDYMGDYGDDYSLQLLNAITGCHEFNFFDGLIPLFTLNICVYPAQNVKNVCKKSSNNPIFNIAWINTEGGWSSFVFEGKKEIFRNIGEVGKFKRGTELKKSNVKEVYNEARVQFANKSQREMEFITSMRTSIQAYLYNDITKTWDIPIFIPREDFSIYKLPYKQTESEGDFSFLYANELTVQTQ